MRSPDVGASTAAMSAGTLVSRVLGVVRQTLVVASIGQGLVGNAYQTANTLPNIIYLLIAGGVLNSVLVPQLVRVSGWADGGRQFTDRIITLALLGFLAVTGVCMLGAGFLVRLYAGGLPPGAASLAVMFALVTLPQVFLYGMSSVLSQVLNARGRVVSPAWAQVLANALQIVGLVAFLEVYRSSGADVAGWSSGMVWLFAGSATAGVAVQTLTLVWALGRVGFHWRPRLGVRGVGLRQTSKVAGWAFAGLAVSQLGFLITNNVMVSAAAASGPQAFIAGNLVYANALSLMILPNSLVMVSVVTALYPRIARAARVGEIGVLRREYRRGLTLPATLTAPASVALLVLAVPVTVLLFSSRDLTQTAPTARVVAAMALGCLPFGIDVLNQRFFYAHDDGATAFKAQLILTGSATAVTLTTLAFRPEHTVELVAGGVVLSNILSAAFGLVVIRRRIGSFGLRRIINTWARIAVACLAAAAVAYLVLRLNQPVGNDRFRAGLAVTTAGLLFSVVYVAFASALQITDIRTLLHKPFGLRFPGRPG